MHGLFLTTFHFPCLLTYEHHPQRRGCQVLYLTGLLDVISVDTWVLSGINIIVGSTGIKVSQIWYLTPWGDSCRKQCFPHTFFNMLLVHIQSWKNQHKAQGWTVSFVIELCLGETRMYGFIESDTVPNSLPSQSLWAVSSSHPSTLTAFCCSSVIICFIFLSVAPGRGMMLFDGFSLTSIVFLPAPLK